jgi:hypothetical protein
MCFSCLGDRIDFATGAPCARCGGSGRDPDPEAYITFTVTSADEAEAVLGPRTTIRRPLASGPA